MRSVLVSLLLVVIAVVPAPAAARCGRERTPTVVESAIRARFVPDSFHSLSTGTGHRSCLSHCGTNSPQGWSAEIFPSPERVRRRCNRASGRRHGEWVRWRPRSRLGMRLRSAVNPDAGQKRVLLTYRVEWRLPGMAEVVMVRPRRNARAARGTAGTDDETMTARLDLLSAILDMSPRLPRNDR